MRERLRKIRRLLTAGGHDAGWRYLLWIAPSVLLAAGLGLRILEPRMLVDFRSKIFDEFQRLKPREWTVDSPVRIIDIDDESLERLGQWPWPRNLLAAMVRRLDAAGAGVIGFDVVFAEPDRSSPKTIAQNLPNTLTFRFTKDLIQQMPDHDADFAAAIAESSVVLGFSFTAAANKSRPKQKAGYLFSDAAVEGQAITSYLQLEKLDREGEKGAFTARTIADYLEIEYDGAVKNLDAFEEAASGIGAFATAPDRDSIIRRVPLVYALGREPYPSLAGEALRVAIGGKSYKFNAGKIKASFGPLGTHDFLVPGLTTAQIPPHPDFRDEVPVYEIPTDRTGHVILYDSNSKLERYIPAWKVFEKDFDAASVDGRMLLVGTSAEGLRDLRTTPVAGVIPGVEIHAQILEQILYKQFLLRPVWINIIETGFMLVLGLALIFLFSLVGALISGALAFGGIGGVFALSWFLFSRKLLLLDPVYPSLVVFAIWAAVTALNYLRSEAEKRTVRGQFSRYLSPDLVEQLANDPSRLSLGGETRELTMMFSDIRGFTPISEQFDAQGLTKFINRFLTPMTDIVIKRKGTIDKYMGDCIMAFWNAPLDNKDHARDACSAALEMMRRLVELNKEWELLAKQEGRKFIPVHTGFGLNTGECCVGNMGSDQRFDYSVLGDPVNLASRLEGQSKSYGVDIVLGKNTRDKIPDFATIELDLLRVKGKLIPVRIYTLLGEEDTASSPAFKELAALNGKMIEAYRAQRWDEAEALIAACRKLDFPLSNFYDLYAARVREGRAEPPGEDWDGVYTATTK